MTTELLKHAAMGAACLMASAAVQAQTLLSEGFENFDSLSGSGWVQTNLSAPPGPTGFFGGDSAAFSSQAGSANSFAAANFASGVDGGTIDNWLITPTFSTALPLSISFYARADVLAPFFDQIRWGVSTGSSTPAAFTVTPAVTLDGIWTQYTLNLPAQGAGALGRFAINYTGVASNSNYIGIDTLTITVVPEPQSWLLLVAGVGALAVAVRRRAAQA